MPAVKSFIPALALFALAACGGAGNETPLGPGPGTPASVGTLKISVTDDPFPIDYVLEASVEISEIQAHDREADAWQTLATAPTTINLVGLTNGIVKTLLDVEVEPGTYDQFRFLTGPGRVILGTDASVADPSRLQTDLEIETPDGTVVADGYVFEIADGGVSFPSGRQTGIKVHVDPPIVVTGELSGDLLLDFDLASNFVFNGPVTHAPGVKRVLFTPSVQATNTSTTGSVMVTVLAGELGGDVLLEGAQVWLEDVSTLTVASTFSDAQGLAKLSAPPGRYTLRADKFGFVAGAIPDVVLVLANLDDAGTLTLAPSELTIPGIVYSDAGTTADASDDFVLGDVSVTLALFDGATLVYEAQATTDGNGSFTFERLEAATYDLTLAREGFATFEATWSPADGPVDVHLVARFETVIATVLDEASAGVADATVTATDGAGNTWTATTDAEGEAALALPTGTYTFTALDPADATYAATDALPVVGDDDPGTSASVALVPSAP